MMKVIIFTIFSDYFRWESARQLIATTVVMIGMAPLSRCTSQLLYQEKYNFEYQKVWIYQKV